MAFGCQFSTAFSDAFEICVTAPVTTPTKGRRPQRISLAPSKAIDLLAIPADIETHVLVAGHTSGEAVTQPALALVERRAAGLAMGETRTIPAVMLVDHAGGGVAVGSLRGVASAGLINDDLEVLYMAGVL